MNTIPKFKVMVAGKRVDYTATEVEANLFRLVLGEAGCNKTILVRVKKTACKTTCPPVKKPCPPVKKECPPVKVECPPVKKPCPPVKQECPPVKPTPPVKQECPVDEQPAEQPVVPENPPVKCPPTNCKPPVHVPVSAADLEKLKTDKCWSWQDWKNFIDDKGQLLTEANQIGPDGKKTDKKAIPYCNPQDINENTTLRHTHWDQILNGVGLPQYAGKIRTEWKEFYHGISFKNFIAELSKLVRADYPEAKSDMEAIELAIAANKK